jgi:SAM-dependent methyltransferase
MSEPHAEFDEYARNYEELLRLPARDRFARDGEFYHRRKWVLISDFLNRNTNCSGKSAWLDIGCGKGELLHYGRSHFERVVGCDLSRQMVRDARGVEVHLQEGPDTLPFPDASFTLATAVCVYHHVEQCYRIELTREIRRVLRPGGVFCMIEHNPYNPVTRLIVNQCPVDVDAHLLTARRSRSYANKAGLRFLEQQYFLYLPQKYYELIGGVERFFKRLPLGGQYAMFAAK